MASASDTIAFADILSAVNVARAKEGRDKDLLDTIGAQTFETLRTVLVQWGVEGFRNGYPILSIQITVPPECSDGVQRSLGDYITFCSGKSLDEHLATLQTKFVDMTLSYANINNMVTILISRA